MTGHIKWNWTDTTKPLYEFVEPEPPPAAAHVAKHCPLCGHNDRKTAIYLLLAIAFSLIGLGMQLVSFMR